MIDRNRKRVCHLTSVHPYADIRIFLKECSTLATIGYEVHLIAAGAPNTRQNGVYLHGTPVCHSRLARMTKTVWAVYQEAVAIDADLYHFHDPELLPVGLALKALDKTVIYDAHEDLPRDVLSKKYLGWLRWFLSAPIESVENLASHHFSAVVAATPTIGARFQVLNRNTIIVNNYPLRNEFSPSVSRDWTARDYAVAYVGVLILDRGIMQMVQAMGNIPETMEARLELAGAFYPPEIRQRVCELKGWQRVRERGLLSRPQVSQLLGHVRAGLILSHPEPNHIRSQPNKLFEYMSAGIPVIASDFPLWREQIETIGCGLLVDPLDPRAIAGAIEYVLTHPEEAEAMGRHGREAVEKCFNWEVESEKLIHLYDTLLESHKK